MEDAEIIGIIAAILSAIFAGVSWKFKIETKNIKNECDNIKTNISKREIKADNVNINEITNYYGVSLNSKKSKMEGSYENFQ